MICELAAHSPAVVRAGKNAEPGWKCRPLVNKGLLGKDNKNQTLSDTPVHRTPIQWQK